MEEFNIYNLESRDKTYVKNNNQKKKMAKNEYNSMSRAFFAWSRS